jgi:hypothetical protein
MIDQVTDDIEFVKTLKSYVALSEAEHIRAWHHFPCVLVHVHPQFQVQIAAVPEEIVLGPVRFRQLRIFLDQLSKSIEIEEKQLDDRALEYFRESAEKHGWVASVEIPSCAQDISRRRAETIIGAAINLLQLFIGLRHAKTMRLPHTAPARNRETCALREVNGKVEWRWQGRALEGALVAGDWFSSIPQTYRDYASYLLSCCLSGKRSEATTRLLDALKWFGDAAFEVSSGVQIAKWIAALERLTTTDQFNTHVFCMRIALLISKRDEASLEQVYRDARRAYRLRSDVMHGSRSQDDDHLDANAGFVHDLTRLAILGALGMHAFIEGVMRDGKLTSIATLYEDNARPFESLFERLCIEIEGRPPRKPRPRKV